MCRPSRSTGLSGGQRYQSLSHLIKEIDLLAEQKLAEIAFPPPKRGGSGGRVMYVWASAWRIRACVCSPSPCHRRMYGFSLPRCLRGTLKIDLRGLASRTRSTVNWNASVSLALCSCMPNCVLACLLFTCSCCARKRMCINGCAPDMIVRQVLLTVSRCPGLPEDMPGS